jgi:hypothetical protein
MGNSEGLARLDALKRDGVLTDAEYAAKRAELIDEAIHGTPAQLTPRSRNRGHVLVGGLGGLWLGVVFVAALLVFVPREKRADRLFGAWLGVASGIALVIVVVLALAIAETPDGTSGSADSMTSDRVVNVLLRCEVSSGYRGISDFERTGDECVAHDYTPIPGAQRIAGQPTGYYPKNVRLEVTVRTPSGSTYVVEAPPYTAVSVGDLWPQP